MSLETPPSDQPSTLLQRIPLAEPTTEELVNDEPFYRRLSDAQKGKILRLHAEGLTQIAIAEQMGVTQPSISRVLSLFTDSTALAKARAKAGSLDVVEASLDQAKKGRAAHTKLMLQVAELIGQDATADARVTVLIGMEGKGTPDPPSLSDLQVLDAQSDSHESD